MQSTKNSIIPVCRWAPLLYVLLSVCVSVCPWLSWFSKCPCILYIIYHFRLKEFKLSSSLEDFVNMEFSQFQKQPWYEKSSKIPPSLPYSLEMAFLKVYSSIMQPSNWYHYQSNLDTELKRAVSISRSLPTSGIWVYCQDKSSRICLALLEKTNQKFEQVLSDET